MIYYMKMTASTWRNELNQGTPGLASASLRRENRYQSPHTQITTVPIGQVVKILHSDFVVSSLILCLEANVEARFTTAA